MVIAFFLRLSSLLFLTFTPFAVRYLMLQVSDVEFITHYKRFPNSVSFCASEASSSMILLKKKIHISMQFVFCKKYFMWDKWKHR